MNLQIGTLNFSSSSQALRGLPAARGRFGSALHHPGPPRPWRLAGAQLRVSPRQVGLGGEILGGKI